MLHAGIERRDGVLIVGDAAPDALCTDLTAFKTCLAVAVETLRWMRPKFSTTSR